MEGHGHQHRLYYPDSLYICQHGVSFFIKESMGMFGKYEMVIMM